MRLSPCYLGSARNDIPPHSVIGHSDIALGRKADPGARFDWRALAQMGFGIWADAVAQSGVDAAVFDETLVGLDMTLMPP